MTSVAACLNADSDYDENVPLVKLQRKETECKVENVHSDREYSDTIPTITNDVKIQRKQQGNERYTSH